jgi:hypothetical protein
MSARNVVRVLILLSSTVGTSCVLEPLDLVIEVHRSALVDGLCACSLCWHERFCSSPLHPGEFPDLVGGACPPEFELAVPASSVDPNEPTAPRKNFFCADVGGVNLNAATVLRPSAELMLGGGWCPNEGTAERDKLTAVDSCRDVMFECRDRTQPAYAGCAETPAVASCPAAAQVGIKVTGCSDISAEAATRKVAVACAHGRPANVPAGLQPERYCFTACVDQLLPRGALVPEPGANGICVENRFDPPEVTAGAYSWLLQGTASTVDISVGADSAHFSLQGEAAFHAPRCLPGMSCPLELPMLRAIVPESFSLGGHDFGQMVLQNPVPIRGGTVSPASTVRSNIVVPAGSEIFATALKNLRPQRSGLMLKSEAPIEGTIDWTSRTVTIDATFSDAATDTTVDLHIVGKFPNRTPIARAGVDRTVECTSPRGALVSLSGTQSFDPDEPQGTPTKMSFNWTDVPTNGGPALAARGSELRVQQSPGTRSYNLTVRDAKGTSTSDSVAITVRDRAPPLFSAVNLPVCIPNDGQMRMFTALDYAAAFLDGCDKKLQFQVLSIVSDQADRGVRSPDIRTLLASQGRFCVRGEREGTATPRRYTVTVRAIDDAGNVRVGSFPVIVPGAACSGRFWPVPAVSGDLSGGC